MGLSTTAACDKSGAGKDFVANLKKGQKPSVEKVQQMASFFSCTTSELLGEQIRLIAVSGDEPSESELVFRSLSPQKQEEALRYMRYLAEQGGK